MELTWSSAGDATQFVLERSLDGAGFVELGLLAGTARQYVDSALTEASTVSYRLRARSVAGDSAFIQSAASTTPPPPPSQLAATAHDANTVALTWTDLATRETEWRIERAPLAGAFSTLATLGADAQGYTDLAAAEGVTSTYRVTVVGPGGERAVSVDVAVPAAIPLNPTAVAPAGVRAVTVSWVDASGAETGFEVQRATGAGAFTTLTTVAAGSTSTQDTTVDWGTSYAYRVRALGPVPSAFSASVGVALVDACLNGIKDGAESDVDCGASCAVACVPGQACTSSADCAVGDTCASTQRCEAPCGPGQYRATTDCVDVGLGWWSPAASDARTACANLPANAEYTSPVASSADCAWSCLGGYLRNSTTDTCDANASARYLRCPAGEVMVGLHGNSGAWLDAMGVICAPYTLGVLGTAYDAPVVGGTGGTVFRLECAAGEVAQKVRAINGWSTLSPNANWCNAINLSRVWLECVDLQTGVVTARGSTSTNASCTVAASPEVSQDCGAGKLMLGVTVDSQNTAGYVGFLLDKVCR